MTEKVPVTTIKTTSLTSQIEIYTDGACSGNPGPGGWGAIICFESGQEQEISGGESYTTNNRMELMGVIKALESLDPQSRISLYTDSLYVRDGMTKWLPNWKKKGWKGSTNKEIKNLDLWQHLDQLSFNYIIQWYWVRGHNGHIQNERADILARNAIVQLLMQESIKK